MLYLLIIFFILWLIRTLKDVLFWIYLWQLKEYHFKRFIDHFRTAKGKDLLLDKPRIIKLALLVSFFLNPLVLFVFVPLLYLVESFKAVINIKKKKLLKPIFTIKTISVSIFVVIAEVVLVLVAFFAIEEKVWLSILFFPLILLIADLMIPILIFFVITVLKPITYISVSIKIARAKRKIAKLKNLIVVAITGSYGKSSVKEFLYEILSEKYKVLKTEKNINAEVGIAETILKKLNQDYQIFVVEAGAYERGKVAQVCKMVKPIMGVLSGIGSQHLATFGSQENIIKGKFELIDCLPKDGTAVLNYDNEFIKKEAEKKNLKKVWCSSVEPTDVFAKNIFLNKDYLSFDLGSKERGSIVAQANLLGKQNIQNLLLASAVAIELGMSLEEISKSFSKIRTKQGGMAYIKKMSPTVLDASYSANTAGVIADLDYLKLYSGKKIIIMPCLIELGKKSKQDHQKIGEKIAEVCDLAIVTTKECLGDIKEKAKQVIFLDKPDEILEKLKEFKGSDDVILLEGRLSKEIIKKIINYFK